MIAELRAGGYDPTTAIVDSREALCDALKEEGWDVAICGDGIPDLDAPSALRLSKEKRPDLPFIVISSVFGESIAAAAMKAGADDFIARGYLARLVPAVERETRAAQMRRSWEQAAQNLRETEARSGAFMDNSPAVAFLKDEEGRLVYVNRTFERVFGVSFEQMQGKTATDWLPAENAAQVRAHDHAVLASGRTMEFEETLPTPEGDRHWLVFKFPFQDRAGRRFVGGVAVDITERRRAEEALRLSEELHRDLVEHSHVLICVHDLEGRILTVNEAAEKNLGYDRRVHLGGQIQNIRDILAPESRGGFDRYLAAIREKGAVSGIMAVQTSAGETRFWDYRNTLRTEGVEAPVVRGLALDVTDRVRAEEALREARQFSEQIIASAGEGIIVYGPDLRYVVWNRFMEELTGIASQRVVGKSPLELFPKIREHGVWELVQKAFAGETISSHDIPFDVWVEGRSGWASATYSPHRNAQGTIVGVIGIIEDVTEQRRAGERLRESQTFLERAQEAGQIGSWISGLAKTDLLIWSKETCRIFGIAPEEFDGKVQTFFAMLHPEDRAAVEKASQSAVDGMEPYSLDHRIVRPDGSVRWVHEQADAVRDESGQPVKMVGTVQDITERRQLEEQFLQSQKMEAIGQLAGGVAHDFNNLLTAILGYSDVLLSQLSEDDPMRGDLEEIHKAGERAASLTQQLLAFSRQQRLEPKIIELNAIVANLQRMLGRLIGEDVTLITRLEPDLGLARADPGQLEQVILNLAVNSRDAMPDGGTLTIETRNVRLKNPLSIGRIAIEPGAYLLLLVSDTGIGMDAAIRARIFEPFFTTKEKGKGTGLGLATAYGVIKQSGGYIACDSEPGRGTTFRIYLPRHPGDAGIPPRPASRPPRRSLAATETVLLVEDEDGVRHLSRRLLETEGYRVLEASGGEEALALAAGHLGPIHLILTDVVMPGLNGPEVAARIVALRPEIRVLYMSGYTDTSLPRLAAQAPLLQKPFTPEALADRVRELLAN